VKGNPSIERHEPFEESDLGSPHILKEKNKVGSQTEISAEYVEKINRVDGKQYCSADHHEGQPKREKKKDTQYQDGTF